MHVGIESPSRICRAKPPAFSSFFVSSRLFIPSPSPAPSPSSSHLRLHSLTPSFPTTTITNPSHPHQIHHQTSLLQYSTLPSIPPPPNYPTTYRAAWNLAFGMNIHNPSGDESAANMSVWESNLTRKIGTHKCSYEHMIKRHHVQRQAEGGTQKP